MCWPLTRRFKATDSAKVGVRVGSIKLLETKDKSSPSGTRLEGPPQDHA
jgi:hypothetical protein